jgi:hypothetical protein
MHKVPYAVAIPYQAIPIMPPTMMATGAEMLNHRPPMNDVAVTTIHQGSDPSEEPEEMVSFKKPCSYNR